MLTLAIGTATYFEDLRPAPLNQCVEQVLRLAPFDPRILSFCGWARLWAGLTQEAHDCFLKSVQLGQLGPFLVASYGGLATCNVQLGRDEDAIRYADEGLKRADSYPTLYAAKAAALAMLDQPEAARDAMAKYRELMPERTLGDWKAANSYGGSTGGQRYFEALRRAGLPE
jgi:tetratricopeptide (TPR) repeat protein